jgi:hypothetical protein
MAVMLERDLRALVKQSTGERRVRARIELATTLKFREPLPRSGN